MSTTEKSGALARGRLEYADLTALLGAFCFFLSTIEYMLPKPLPFLRLGIANLPILLAVDLLPLPWFMVLALVKVIGMSLVSGSLFSFVALFSFAGTMMAAVVMRAAKRLGKSAISAVGVSVLGATASNAVQVLLATFLVFGEAARLVAPVFLGMGLVTGLALGVFVEGFSRVSAWMAIASGKPDPRLGNSDGGSDAVSAAAGDARGRSAARKGRVAPTRTERAMARASRREASKLASRERRARRAQSYLGLFDPGFLALAGVAISLAFLFQDRIAVRAAMCACFFVVSVFAGKGFSPVATAVTMAGIVAANLLVPLGKVIAAFGPFELTSGALAEGFDKALVFEGLIFLSRATISPTLRLPGRLGGVIASAFAYYDRVLEHKGSLRPATLLRDADELMLKVWESRVRGSGDTATVAGPEPRAGRGGMSGEDSAVPKPRAAGMAALAIATAAAYALLFV